MALLRNLQPFHSFYIVWGKFCIISKEKILEHLSQPFSKFLNLFFDFYK